ncbi:basic secretory family protein [Actinomadura rupiterrae]|uniref:basic secretory family protein n=1 Tax=Actinomadura rupiterrae TaxID=559627 RepID=UPI0020A32CEA|nr:basic secretory family protein [Actinomadura rupiterrae]MCP2338505.1 hypothetical protein [Actinomadura rupiterrae]
MSDQRAEETPSAPDGGSPAAEGGGPPREPASASRRRALGLLAAGGAALLAAGGGIYALTRDQGGSSPDEPSASPVGTPDPQAVAAVLANRARAVRERNRIAFLATVADAPAAFQQAQARLFDNLLKIPLDGWEERPGQPHGSSGVVQVTMRYRIAGFDGGPVARTRYLAFAPRSGSWTITGDGSSARLADDADILDAGPLTVVRKGPALVVGDASGLDEIARRLASAVPAVTGVVGTSWARRAVALAPADAALAGRIAGGGQDVAQFAALAVVAPGPDGSPGQDRIVVSPTFGRLNALGRDVVLTHELTHVATGGARDGRTPIWLIEGFADYVGYRGAKVAVKSAARELAADASAGRLPDALPSRADFDGASGRLSQAYQEAWLACRMVADRYGEATLVRLYRAAGREPEAAALRRTLGLSPDAFTADWRDYLRKELS